MPFPATRDELRHVSAARGRGSRPFAGAHAQIHRVLCACFGVVNLRTSKFIRQICSVFSAQTFRRLLKRMLRHRRGRGRMMMVLDSAHYHQAVLPRLCLGQHAKHL